MIKPVTKAALLAWLKEQAEDAYEGLVEGMSRHIGDGGDWEPVDDDTPLEELPLLINHEAEVVKILAKHRLEGHSVYGPEVQQELYDLLQNDINSNKYDMEFKLGRFYIIAKLYEDIGEKELADQWKSWAWFSPYD